MPGRALLPDALLQDAWSLQERTALVVDDAGLIHSVAAVEELPANLPVTRFPGEVWTAAPVLAHAHLESFDAPSQEWRGRGFAGWVERLLAWRADAERMSAQQSAQASLQELRLAGCGAVLSHVAEAGAEGQGGALPQVQPWPEFFAPEPDRMQEAMGRPADQGFALHAPYSVSLECARMAFTDARRPLSIHLGEHAEERHFLADGAGPLAELWLARGRSLPQQRFASPVDWLEATGGLRPGVLAVHGTDLRAEELRTLAASGVQLVFCPGTHEYFQRPQPAFLEAGIPLPALGCDSRASNAVLDPLREFRLAHACMPQPGAQAWWQALTERGAAALGRGDLGRLEVGRLALPLRLHEAPALASAADTCAWLLQAESLRLSVGLPTDSSRTGC